MATSADGANTQRPTLPQRLGGEFVGTFALVLAAVGSAVSCGPPVSSGMGIQGAALANGLVLAVIVATFGPISGAHFNPAVSVALWFVGRLRPAVLAAYVAAQMLAATLAALMARAIYPTEAIEETRLALCGPAPWLSEPVATVLLVELVLTFLLMLGIYGTVIDRRGPQFAIGGGVGVGAIVAANILAAGAVTGAAMNPARAFGPAAVQFDYAYHWCYWVAPVAGAVLAAVLYERLFLRQAPENE